MVRKSHYILGLIFFALLFINAGVTIIGEFHALRQKSDPGWSFTTVGAHLVIRRNADPLRAGDQILAINEHRVSSAEEIEAIFERMEPFEPYSIIVHRGGTVQEFQLMTRDISPLQRLSRISARLILAPTFLLIGFIVFLLKPGDKQALLLSLMLSTFPLAINPGTQSYEGEPLWLGILLVSGTILSYFFWPIFFHFFLIFPEPSPLLRRFRALPYLLYVPHLLTLFPYLAILAILGGFHSELVPGFTRTYMPWFLTGLFVGVLYITGGLLSLLTNYQQANRASRRKMRIVVAGSIAAFLPITVVLALAFLFDLPARNPEGMFMMVVPALFAVVLFPLSFAYAIIRHRVIPVHLIVRRGVRYLLVSRGFIIIQGLVVFGTLAFLLTGSRMEMIDQWGARADIVVTMVVTALAIAVLTWVNQRVMPYIDRRFFRENYDAQALLTELGQEIRTVTTVEQLLKLSAARIQHALHAEHVMIFLKDEERGDYRRAIGSRLSEKGAVIEEALPDESLPARGLAIDRLARNPQPLTVELENPRSWLYPMGALRADAKQANHEERETLRRIKSALLIPIAVKDDLLGVISLGPRLGDLPYSREDRQLLMAVAWQMAIAIQNTKLVRQAAEEERLRHELEIATSVQRRLFPSRPPAIDTLELAGVCLPAEGVGGDYYDFIKLGNQCFGIAVADVAGKGISAALLMSIVQASLRSQAAAVNGDLIALVSSMNRLLHLSTDSRSYATFFYAQYDDKQRTLTYINAGHNPPILVRAGAVGQAHGVGRALAMARAGQSRSEGTPVAAAVTALSTGGPVIGLFGDCRYEQETIELRSGDILIAYTDGITEAQNIHEEEFGETRLWNAIAASANLPAQELAEKVVGIVREWTGNRLPHDDLTLVVMKVK